MKKRLILGLSAATLISGFVINGVFADTKDIELRIGSSLTLSVPESTNLILDTSGSGIFRSTYFDVTASTNNESGFTLSLATDKTFLESGVIDPNTGEKAKIEAIPFVDGGITEDTFSASTESSIINHWGISIGNTSSYNPVLLSSIIKQTEEDVTGDVTRINVAAKANSELIPATYVTSLNFQLVANVVEPDEGTEFLCTDSTCSEDPTDPSVSSTHIDGRKNNVSFAGGTFERAFEVAYVNAGKGMYIPQRDTTTGEYTGKYNTAVVGRDYLGFAFNEYRFAMQDMTSEICDSVTVEHDSIQLVDIRDGKSYWVTKLNDGHCWMTQDLNLIISKDITLTSNDTDLTYYGDKGYTTDFGYTNNGGVISWTPFKNMRSANYTDGGYLVEKYDQYEKIGLSSVNVGVKNVYQVDDYFAQYECDFLVGPYKCVNFFETDPQVKNEHRHIGNYYNWTAAVASNNTSSFNNSTQSDISENPQNSICPKGWRLPTVSYDDETVAGSTNEFYRLRKVYGSDEDSSDQAFVDSPLYFNRGGYITDSCSASYEECLRYSGYNVEYWSSTVQSTYSSYAMYGHNSNATNDYADRAGLRLVRCIAR